MDKIPVWSYNIGIPASVGLDVNVRCLYNWIFAQVKIVIVYSRFNKYKSFIYLFIIMKLSIYIKNKLVQGMTFSKSTLRKTYSHFYSM